MASRGNLPGIPFAGDSGPTLTRHVHNDCRELLLCRFLDFRPF
jgi:hypothetical protein